MFDYIFEAKLITVIIALILTWVTFLLIKAQQFWLRGIFFSYGPAFASAFFVAGFFYKGQVNEFDLIAGFIFEFTVLMISTMLVSHVIKWVRNGLDANVEAWLRWSLILQLFAASPLFLVEGAGIFSEGSRINYFHESSVVRYLGYMGVLTAYVQAALLAKRLSSSGDVSYIGYVIILATFVISTLSGSKGGGFLWLAAFLSLVDFRNLKLRWLPIACAFLAVVFSLWITAGVISELLSISEMDFVELAIARFFLNNDARALAFDWGGQSAALSEFLAATFRSFANLLGYPSSDPPLGLLLNEKQTGLFTGNGPNASLIALIIYYSAKGYAFLPALLACFGGIFIYFVVVFVRRRLQGELVKMASSIIGIVIVQLFSQDFLAFPLGIASAIVAVALFFHIDRKYSCVKFGYYESK
jgi:hypothetical protein